MTTHPGHPEDFGFQTLLQAVTDDPENPEKLRNFYQQSVATSHIEDAEATLKKMQQQYPWNHHIRRALIALCLHQNDYAAAMPSIETLLAFSSPDDALIDSALAVRRHLGPLSVDAHSNTGPVISLCMIVRNEGLFLAPCLHAIKDLVNEIVVVDTGSTDRSADIARIFGARVYHFSWCDDFSAARNASLEKAHGDWIMILDADEVIAPQDHALLKQIAADPNDKPQAYSIETRNYSNLANAMDWQENDGSYPQQETGMGWFPTSKVRLFPRRTDIRFQYPVHELVDPSIYAAGLPIVNCAISIHHYGHLNEAKNAKKAEHYFELGYAKLEQLGNHGAALRELAVQAGQLEKWSQAIELWQRLLELCPDNAEALANLAGACWQLNDFKQGLAFANQATQLEPRRKEGYYNAAINLLLSGRIADAAAVLQDLHQRHPRYLAAEFMLEVADCLCDNAHEAGLRFRTLEKKLSGPAVVLAVQKLIQKLSANGLSDYADKLAAAIREA